MATGNGTTSLQDPTKLAGDEFAKGKGKAPATEEVTEDTSMVEDDDDDDDDDAEEEAAEEEDNMEEIDLENVIGRRTRGKVIDFAKAAQENPVDADDDEEDDEDFELQEEAAAVDDADKMDED